MSSAKQVKVATVKIHVHAIFFPRDLNYMRYEEDMALGQNSKLCALYKQPKGIFGGTPGL